MGCGWLGIPLAEKFLKHGIKVKGSTTTKDKIDELSSKGIDPYLIELDHGELIGNAENFFSGAQVGIINIPPRLRHSSNGYYLDNLKVLIECIKSSGVEKIIFISSTSVYKDTEDFVTITEDPMYLSSSEKATILTEAERLFLDNPSFKTNVIRFSGLIGPNRHPATYLSGRDGIKDPEAPINLIHLEDCIRLIMTISFNDHWGDVYNASYPDHPSRSAYYTAICKSMGLPLPSFNNSDYSVGKRVCSKKLQSRFKFQFEHGIY